MGLLIRSLLANRSVGMIDTLFKCVGQSEGEVNRVLTVHHGLFHKLIAIVVSVKSLQAHLQPKEAGNELIGKFGVLSQEVKPQAERIDSARKFKRIPWDSVSYGKRRQRFRHDFKVAFGTTPICIDLRCEGYGYGVSFSMFIKNFFLMLPSLLPGGHSDCNEDCQDTSYSLDPGRHVEWATVVSAKLQCPADKKTHGEGGRASYVYASSGGVALVGHGDIPEVNGRIIGHSSAQGEIA